MTSEGIPSNGVIKRRRKSGFPPGRVTKKKKKKKNRKDFVLYETKIKPFSPKF